MDKYKKAFLAAFPLTLPICAAFLVFAGSMEFVLVGMLLSAFNPWYCYLMTLMVNSRHLFYGLSMLEKFKDTGWKKIYLIFGMCDESFAINVSTSPPEGVDKGWFMTFVTLLNQIYWVVGSTIGGLMGSSIKINTQGLDFSLVALFVAIFVSQWQNSTNHNPAIIGIILPLVCLVILGPQSFVPPAMLLMLILFITAYYKGGIKL